MHISVHNCPLIEAVPPTLARTNILNDATPWNLDDFNTTYATYSMYTEAFTLLYIITNVSVHMYSFRPHYCIVTAMMVGPTF